MSNACFTSIKINSGEFQESIVITGECHKENPIENLNVLDFQLSTAIKCYWLAEIHASTSVHKNKKKSPS